VGKIVGKCSERWENVRKGRQKCWKTFGKCWEECGKTFGKVLEKCGNMFGKCLGILAGKNEGEEMRRKWWEHVFYYGHLLRISDDLRCLIPKNCTQTPHLEETCGKVPSYITKGYSPGKLAPQNPIQVNAHPDFGT
jgi:hypothetical protein